LFEAGRLLGFRACGAICPRTKQTPGAVTEQTSADEAVRPGSIWRDIHVLKKFGIIAALPLAFALFACDQKDEGAAAPDTSAPAEEAPAPDAMAPEAPAPDAMAPEESAAPDAMTPSDAMDSAGEKMDEMKDEAGEKMDEMKDEAGEKMDEMTAPDAPAAPTP